MLRVLTSSHLTVRWCTFAECRFSCKHESALGSLYAQKSPFALALYNCKRTNIFRGTTFFPRQLTLSGSLRYKSNLMLWYPCVITDTTPSKPTAIFSRMLQDVFMTRIPLRLSPTGHSLWFHFCHYFFSSLHLWSDGIKGRMVCQEISLYGF